MADLIEVEFTEASGLRETTDPIVTIDEAKYYRSKGYLIIPDKPADSLTLDDFWGEEFRDRNDTNNLVSDL